MCNVDIESLDIKIIYVRNMKRIGENYSRKKRAERSEEGNNDGISRAKTKDHKEKKDQ